MTDDVKAVSQRILDRAADQIGTHSANCHEYHLPCFAAFVMRELEAATSAPAVDREALAKVIHERFNMARGKTGVEPLALADQIFASGILRDVRNVQAEGADLAADWLARQLWPDAADYAGHVRQFAQAIREARND